jgi:hypothetical protein
MFAALNMLDRTVIRPVHDPSSPPGVHPPPQSCRGHRARRQLVHAILHNYAAHRHPTADACNAACSTCWLDLQAAINRYLAEHNRKPKPFDWTAHPDRIIEKVNREYQVMASDR